MTQPVSIEASVLALFLPAGTLEWFELVEGMQTDDGIRLVLEEKNVPPLRPEHEGKYVSSKGFYDITITDFPIRGKRASLVFRRRRWKVEGEKELLKRDIPLCAPDTGLETEFADFLKGASRDTRELFDEHC
jgi:hypothetical protein